MLKYLVAITLVACSTNTPDKKETETTTQPSEPTEQPNPIPVPLPSPTPSIPGGGVAEVQQFMIFHNLKRCWHDAPRVKWSNELAAKAKVDAETCELVTVNPYDSIAYGKDLGIVKAQDNWYMQFLQYPYGKDEYTKSTKDFAHIVWQSTQLIGCAKVQCASQSVIYCKYEPQAIGSAKDQVKFLKSDFMKCNGTN